MPSAYNWHPESGYLGPSPILRRKAGFALPFVVFGAIAAASGVVLQMADSTPTTDDRSSIAAILTSDRLAHSTVPLTFPTETELPRGPNTIPAPTESTPSLEPGATLAASTVSLEPNADGAPDRPQDFATEPAPAESTPPSEPSVTLARSMVSPGPNADGVLDSPQDSAAEPAPADAAPDLTATKPSRSSVASKKPRKSAQTQNQRRDQGYNAEERAWFNRASRVY